MSLTTKENKSLDLFAHLANKSGLHQRDIDRWNNFVITTISDDSSATRNDVEKHLLAHGFDVGMASNRADRFKEDQDLLRRFIAQKTENR